MMELPPNPIDAEIYSNLPGLADKFVVDFSNGIDISRDHIRVQRSRNNFVSRLYDGFSGQGVIRQTEINSNLVAGVEGALIWLTELTELVAHSNLALVRVNERIGELQSNVALLARFAADNHHLLESLSVKLTARCNALADEIARVDFEQRAERQLVQVFDKWAAGRFNSFSVLGRLYAVLDELYWGDFGDYCRINDNSVRSGFLQQLAHKAIAQMKNDCGSANNIRPAAQEWLNEPVQPALPDGLDALAYLGDWTTAERHPFAFTTTQVPDDLPLRLPRLFTADRAAKALVKEVFERRGHG